MKHRIKLKDVASFSKGQQINGDELLPHGEYAYLNGGINPSGRWSEYNVEGNTVTVSEGGNSSGYINFMESPFWCGAHCYYLFDINGNSKYLYYALKSQQDRVMSIRSGACMPNIKKADLGNFELYFDDDGEEQQDVVVVLDRISSIIEARKQQLFELDNLVKARFVEMLGDPVRNPKGWSSVGLLELGSCKNGMNFHTDDAGVEVHCLGVGDFKDKSVISDTSVLPLVSLNEMPSGEYLLQDGDIVFVRSNGNKALVGRCLAVFPGQIQTTFSGFCIRFRKSSHEITTEFLIHVLKTESMRKKMQGRGANIQNLNQQILGSLSIPVPPVDLQNRFSEFVAQVDKSKLSVQKSLDQLETLKKALMQQYFE